MYRQALILSFSRRKCVWKRATEQTRTCRQTFQRLLLAFVCRCRWYPRGTRCFLVKSPETVNCGKSVIPPPARQTKDALWQRWQTRGSGSVSGGYNLEKTVSGRQTDRCSPVCGDVWTLTDQILYFVFSFVFFLGGGAWTQLWHTFFFSLQNEIFASRHQDVNSVACIEDKCYVLTLAQYCRWVKSRLFWMLLSHISCRYLTQNNI